VLKPLQFKRINNEISINVSSEAYQALSLYTEVTKSKESKKSCVVELIKVVYQDGKPCTAKFITRKNVSEKAFIEEKKTTKVVIEKKTEKKTTKTK